jgi:hypothetical protein
LFGLWLVAAPWLLDAPTALAAINSILCGMAVIALSLPRGTRSQEHYGTWDRYVV